MGQDGIGVAAVGHGQRLARADSDDLHIVAGLLLELGHQHVQEAGVLGAGGGGQDDLLSAPAGRRCQGQQSCQPNHDRDPSPGHESILLVLGVLCWGEHNAAPKKLRLLAECLHELPPHVRLHRRLEPPVLGQQPLSPRREPRPAAAEAAHLALHQANAQILLDLLILPQARR